MKALLNSFHLYGHMLRFHRRLKVIPQYLVHGPDHFSVPNLRTKPKCFQLILLHEVFSNLYDNLSE